MTDLLSFILENEDSFRRARLPSLYSDFTIQKVTNPDGYAANIAAWETALAKAVKAGLAPSQGQSHDRLSFLAGGDLLKALETPEWGKPLALGAVFDEAVARRQVINYEECFNSPVSIYQRRWTINPSWLLHWGMRQLGITSHASSANTLPIGRFVIIANIEEYASIVLKQLSSRKRSVDRILPLAEFEHEVASALDLKDGVSDTDFQLITKFLARDKNAIVQDHDVVKLRAPEDGSPLISHEEKTIASLKSLISRLEEQTKSLSKRTNELTSEAKKALEVKNTSSAKRALHSKRMCESVLEQRSQILSQLEEIFTKIEQAVDQVAIVRVMKASAVALKNLNGQTGGVEKVEDVVEQLQDEMVKVDEVGSLLQDAGQGEAPIDEDQIEEELEALARQQQLDKEAKEVQNVQELLEGIDVPETVEKSSRQSTESELAQTSDKAAETISEGDEALVHKGTKEFDRLSLGEESTTSKKDARQEDATPDKCLDDLVAG